MTPVLIVVTLGGVLVLLSGFVSVLYRLGGFQLTARERRSWTVTGAVLLAWVVLLAFIGPLPPPLALVLTAGSVLMFVWAWRTGRFRLDRMPADAREEVARRREWMRTHAGLLVALWIGFTVSMVVWVLAVVILTRPG
jgi:hypothetical protein